MAKIDLKKELKQLYSASASSAAIIDVAPAQFLMIDGSGDPNTSQDYQEAIQALYSAAYTLKFKIKKGEAALDYAVMPLEGLWWADDMRAFSEHRKDQWKWTLMIMQPDVVTPSMFKEVLAQVEKNKPGLPLHKVRLEPYQEGLCAQILHVGPYAAEQPTIARLHAFIEAKGYQLHGKHHEIYLGDPRKSAPEKLKTILRQPITLTK